MWLPSRAYVRDVTNAIHEQWRSTGRQRAQNSTIGSFQLMHMSRDEYNCSRYGGQNEDKALLQRLQSCHKGEFRHVSISVRQLSLRCGQNLCGPFLRATLPMTVEQWGGHYFTERNGSDTVFCGTEPSTLARRADSS